MPNKPRNAKIEAGKKIRSGNARPRGRQKHGHDLRERADVSADLVCDATGSDDFPVKVGADIVFLGVTAHRVGR